MNGVRDWVELVRVAHLLAKGGLVAIGIGGATTGREGMLLITHPAPTNSPSHPTSACAQSVYNTHLHMSMSMGTGKGKGMDMDMHAPGRSRCTRPR